jgi:hypothetical protein
MADALRASIEAAHEALWARFWRPESRLFYERQFGDDREFPTAEEIAAGVPNVAGWATGMEDSCLNGAWILDGLLVACRVTGEAAYAAKAREVFLGLARLGSLAPLKGFVARSTAPGRDEFYANSSADQFTAFVCAMVRYATSPVATPEERGRAKELVLAVAQCVEGFGDDLPNAKGEPSIYGDTSSVHPGRACRLLLFYKAAHAVSGDSWWERIYLERAWANGALRLAARFGPEPTRRDQNLHAHYQSQAAWRLLHDLEDDPELKKSYRAALDSCAAAVLARAGDWRAWRPDFAGTDLPWRECWKRFVRENPGPQGSDLDGQVAFVRYQHALVPGLRYDLTELRRPADAFGICMLAVDPALRAAAARQVAPAEFAKARASTALACLEGAYWRGVEEGLFRR